MVAKLTTIRIFITIVVCNNWSISQLDVSNAFLHGHLTKQVFMRQPPSFIHLECPTHICKLNKDIYGLKQSPQNWFATLSTYLQELGFCQSQADQSLHIL